MKSFIYISYTLRFMDEDIYFQTYKINSNFTLHKYFLQFYFNLKEKKQREDIGCIGKT